MLPLHIVKSVSGVINVSVYLLIVPTLYEAVGRLRKAQASNQEHNGWHSCQAHRQAPAPLVYSGGACTRQSTDFIFTSSSYAYSSVLLMIDVHLS